MKSRARVLLGAMMMVVLGCAGEPPTSGPPDAGAGGHGLAHPTVSTATSTGSAGGGGGGVGGAGGGVTASASSSTGAPTCDPATMPMWGKCGTTHCAGTTWINDFEPEGLDCNNPAVEPYAECDGAGKCVGKPPPGCGTVKLTPGTDGNDCNQGCDDGNECTFDKCVANVCTHAIFTHPPEGGDCQKAGFMCFYGYCCNGQQP